MKNKHHYTCKDLSITNEKILEIPDMRFYDVRRTPEMRIYGLMDAKDGKRFCRIPEEVAEKANSGVVIQNYKTASGRVRFVTTSDHIALKTYVGIANRTLNMSPLGEGSYDVYVKMSGKETFVRGFTPPVPCPDGFDGILQLPKGEKEVTLYLPNYRGVNDLYIGLDGDARLSRHPDYKIEKPIIYCGSSITQGGCASRSGLSYESIICRKLDCNYINLGFSGSFKAEDAMIEYIATLDASVMVFDYDHNAPTAEHLERTHERLYLAYREAHPDTPVVFVGRPDFRIDLPAFAVRRRVISTTYENARKRGERVYFVDGQSLFAGDMREDCTVDGTHPNDIGMKRMADVIGEIIQLALYEYPEVTK